MPVSPASPRDAPCIAGIVCAHASFFVCLFGWFVGFVLVGLLVCPGCLFDFFWLRCILVCLCICVTVFASVSACLRACVPACLRACLRACALVCLLVCECVFEYVCGCWDWRGHLCITPSYSLKCVHHHVSQYECGESLHFAPDTNGTNGGATARDRAWRRHGDMNPTMDTGFLEMLQTSGAGIAG